MIANERLVLRSKGGGHDLSYVLNPDGLFLAPNQSVEVHQARHIGRRQNFCPRALVIEYAVAAHHAGNGFLGDGEQASEAAAFIGAGQFSELNST
jgi:hypothetical protein